LREPRKPKPPALAQLNTLPRVSAIVTMVLLNVERICATPVYIFLRSFRLVRTTFFAATTRLSLLTDYFFLPETLRFGPLRVRALFLVF